MNATEKKYLVKRLDEIKNSLLAKVKALTSHQGKALSYVDQALLILAGKVKIDPLAVSQAQAHLKHGHYWHPSMCSLFDFSEYSTYGSLDQESATALTNKVNSQYTDITDQLMLGDAKEALSLLKKFSEMDIEAEYKKLNPASSPVIKSLDPVREAVLKMDLPAPAAAKPAKTSSRKR